MRFVNTRTINLIEIPDSEVSSLEKGYAILSHRWLDDEVTFNELQSQTYPRHGKGFAKLQGACVLASRLGYELIWMDTCCIDKSSSTELSETINSMYRWYSDAAICIAYLSDVLQSEDIGNSVWFDRGWTLQELIAPKNVLFYGSDWRPLDSKHVHASTLSARSRIPIDVLTGIRKPQTYSVAQRMSWAASRTTTRVEDMAYSLLGLFDVNMAMIYGEREQAFVRLQEEIIKKSADQSIFAWNLGPEQRTSGMLAPSVVAFRDCSDASLTSTTQGFMINNTGLSLKLLTKPYSLETYVAALEVSVEGAYRVSIFLTRLKDEGRYIRTRGANSRGLMKVTVDASWELRQVSARQNTDEEPAPIYQGFWLRQLQFPSYCNYEPSILSRGFAFEPDRIALPEGAFGTTGIIWMKSQLAKDNVADTPWFHVRWLAFGFDSTFSPVCLVSRLGSACELYKRSPAHSFQEALKWPAGSQERSDCLVFNDRWIMREGSQPSLRDRWSSEFFVLRGDRNQGLEASLEVVGLNIKIKRCPDPSSMIGSSSLLSYAQDLWTVDITSSGETDHRLFARCSRSIPCY